MNMIKGLLHTHIIVPRGQLESARRFYCGVLGLEEIEMKEALAYVEGFGFWIRVGTDSIYIREVQNRREASGNVNLVYEVANIEDMRIRLKAYGMTIYEYSYDYYETCICYDPFGNQLQFIMPKLNLSFI